MKTLRNIRGQKGQLQWIARHTRPFAPALAKLLLLGGGAAVIGVGQTLFNKWIIDSATAGGAIWQGVAAYVAVAVLSLLVGAVQSVYSTLVNERFAFGIRTEVYRSVMNACWRDVGAYHSGDVVTRLSSDIDIVATGIAEVIPSVFTLGITFVAAFVTLAWFDIGFALFALVLGPVTALIGLYTARRVKPLQVKVQESESAYKSALQESIENLVVVKAFEGQDAAAARLGELRNDRLHWLRKRQKISALSGMALSGSFQLGYIAAFSYSAFRLSTAAISYGTMSVFLSLVTQIQAPVVGLSRLVPRMVSILASTGRIMELENLAAEDRAVPPLAEGPLRLEVERLTFGYNEEAVLRDLNLTVERGEFVALMGSSGIGKTTLIRLIMAYYQPDGGRIELRDAAGGTAAVTAGVRHYMAYVPQGNTLMSGSIAHNLRMGRAGATEEEIWRILRVVAAEEFVREAPNGLDTVLGERGYGLSEGQAQRLAIARALLKDAPLLILDEATSALDEATELAVLEHLRRQTPRPTCIIITHRRSILRFCERCIRIDDAGGIQAEAL